MEDSCGQFEERLSAYLDGRLPPDEMAEIADHLDRCSICSALLDKMRQLGGMASEFDPGFDEAVMSELTDRISNGLDNVEDSAERQSRPKAKIIPMWHKYAAVAASVAFVFFAGRMAFKDTGTEFNRPEQVSPSIQLFEEPKTTTEYPGVPEAGDEKTADEITASDKSPAERKEAVESRKKGYYSPDGVSRQDIPVNEASSASPEEEQEGVIQAPSTAVMENGEIPAPVSKTEKMRDDFDAGQFREHEGKGEAEIGSIISGRITDEQTGEPLVGVAVQIEGTSLGAMTDFDGNYMIQDVPPDTYDIFYSAIGYYGKELSDIMVDPGSLVKADAEVEMMALSVGEVEAVNGARERIAFKSTAASSRPTDDETGRKENVLTIDSLEVLYELATSSVPVNYDLIGIDAAPVKDNREIRIEKVQTMLDSIESSPKRKALYARLENLYFLARASYDLYRQTRDDEYLRRAGQYKKVLDELIEEQLEQDENNKTLQEYKAELERWRF